MPEAAERRILENIKINCLSHGLKVTDPAFEILKRLQGGLLSIHEYPTTGGLTLELPHQVYVNAPFDEDFCADAVVTLDAHVTDGLFLRLGDDSVPVLRQLPLPGYLDVIASNGRPVAEVVMSHGDRARISPIDGCAYDCGFCDMADLAYTIYEPEFLVEALHVAAADPVLPVRHVLISGGSPRTRHYERFEEQVLAVVAGTDMPVDLMMSPMVNNPGFLARVKGAGIADFSINIEVFAEQPALDMLGMKYKVTRRHFAAFVEDAVALTAGAGSGVTRSLIIPGLESMDETLAGVEFLVGLGCVPVISPFRPAAGTAAAGRRPVPAADLRELLDRSRDLAAEAGLHIGPECIACQHNTLNFPWDVAA